MEWIEGPTLLKWVASRRKDRPVKWDEVKAICAQIVKGVQQLHVAGIHHRDLKTENIMLKTGNKPVIMDVGIAEIARGAEHSMHTRVKDFLGSVRYASPQFLRGEDFDPGDDVYSLGCIFLELVTGQQPYHQQERKVLLPAIVLQGPPNVPNEIEAYAKGLDVLIRGCVHPERSRRPTLDDLSDFFDSSKESEYVQIERLRQFEDQRGWPVLQVNEDEIFVDLGSYSGSLIREFKLVRLGEPIILPSSGEKRIVQQLIGSVRHLHSNGGLAHFRFTREAGQRSSMELQLERHSQARSNLPKVGDRVVI